MAAPSLSQPYSHDLSTTRKLETERRYALELRESCLKEIIAIEVNMGIEKRWDPSSPEYLETLGYLSTRTYQRALEELQRLVIQRLFELHKMNISATGESLTLRSLTILNPLPQPITCERTLRRHYRVAAKQSGTRSRPTTLQLCS